MFERVPFRREHLETMLSQPINESARQMFSGFTSQNFDMVESRDSFTGMMDGNPVVCGGIVPLWPGRGSLWTVFDERSKQCFVPVFRGIKAFLKEAGRVYNRLEIAVPYDFKIGIRRARLLGFALECERAVRYLPDGKDCSLFVYLGGQ